MKQFFNVFLTVLTVCFAVNLTSCSSDEDDDSKSQNEKIKVYTACVSEDVLDLYNVKIILHRGNNSKEITLSKSGAESQTIEGYTLYGYQYDAVDGKHGIDSVEVVVNYSDQIESQISAMDPEKELLLVEGRDFTSQTYSSTGHYDAFKNLNQRLSISAIKAAALLNTSSSSNTKMYELEAKKIKSNLTAK